MPTRIQIRRGLASEWTSENPTLASGELGFETDTRKFKIGDGAVPWNDLSYSGEETNAFTENDAAVDSNYTITSGRNAVSAGPITISPGVIVTVPDTSNWVLV